MTSSTAAVAKAIWNASSEVACIAVWYRCRVRGSSGNS